MYDDPDRRVRRTRRALAAALISLTAERPYHSIQVRDITDQADVGYATFYRHYESKDDLMLAVFAEVTAELEASAGEPGGEYFEQEGRLLFEHVQKYEGLYRSILQSWNFVDKLKKLLAQRVEDHLQRHALQLDDLAFPIELAANHMVAGLIGLIEWWLEKEMPLPADEMARIYERLIIQATWYALPSGNNLSLPWHA
jgi:AcrR family transcriptional regulator